MGVKANLIGHNGYLEGDTAYYIQTGVSVGDYYQPVYLNKINEEENKGTITACEYNEVYYNVQLGQFVRQQTAEQSAYPYVYDYADQRITSNTYAQVLLGPEDATSGVVSPIVKTINGFLRIYANQALTELTLQTLALFNLHKAEDWSQAQEQ